jgi:signal transduction histidine kinase
MTIFSSLTNRIFIASAALAILCISVAIYVVNARVTASADTELSADLTQTGAVVDRERERISRLFTVYARFVDEGSSNLKAAVSTDDPPTVAPRAAEYQLQANADLLLVTDGGGRVLANLARNARVDPGFASLATVRDALGGRERSMFWLRPDGLAQVVSVPITAGANPPEIIGSFSLGFLLNDDLARQWKGLTGSEIAFAAGGRVVASTLPGGSRETLAALLRDPDASGIAVGGNDYAASVQPLAPPGATTTSGAAAAPRLQRTAPGDRATPAVIILRSRTERLRFLQPIRTALIATGIFAVLLAIVLSYAIARTIAGPLATITATMREMAATGDLTRKIAWRSSRWEDEDARLLARTFNTLTESVTRFQREAAERERLSALGRLSTVIAHEVRNPLMIIKASLQPLARGTPSPEAIREAAQDISGEVTRLNRLVNEVLDFARPLRYDFAVTDVNRVCEDSAAAASADHESPPVHVDLDRSLTPLMTDGERLRSALVNILVNAQHAVAARVALETVAAKAGSGSAATNPALRHHVAIAPPPEQPEVELKTMALPAGAAAIVVRDRGIGIAPADLPRVFEPYFTTKRTGTGLGLAIARNIVEGLGGTIGITSQPGIGTEIRIELPNEGSGLRAQGSS